MSKPMTEIQCFLVEKYHITIVITEIDSYGHWLRDYQRPLIAELRRHQKLTQ